LLGAKYGSETRDIPSEPGSPLHLRGIPWWISLAEGRYKYIRTLQNNEIEELYDLKRDPEELNNLAINPRFTKRLGNMRQKLVAELERTDAPLVDTLPPVRSQVK
jgi:arylsulfatase A-like enzyme